MMKSSSLQAVAQVWNYRRRVELEAADQFQRMSKELATLYGQDEIFFMTDSAAQEEKEHAKYCENILFELQENLPPLEPELGGILGPVHLEFSKRVLYSFVSLCCITETFSTALLIEMQNRAKMPVVRQTIHDILKDEISHSRVGWAQLSRVAKLQDVSWLSSYIPDMIEAAMITDLKPIAMTSSLDLSEYGILSKSEVNRIIQETTKTVILPGLSSSGLSSFGLEI